VRRAAKGALGAIATAIGLSLAGAAGCAALRPMTARPADLDDYRAFRVAAAEGTRLARAKRYLERHPEGAFAAEVRAAFEEEEPRYFEAAQGSREAARRYLADLPDGPHAAAALALLTALESNMKEAELRDIARRVRYEDAKLEVAAEQRRAVGESILAAVGVLLDDDVYGVPRASGPPELRALMLGPTPTTWGTVPARREQDLFFLLPTRPERESRLLTLEISLGETDGVVTSATVEGSDMFVRWAEADEIVKLDPSALDDRTEAQIHAQSLLEGALERRFPQGSCPDRRSERELYHRVCGAGGGDGGAGGGEGGWEAIVIAGSAAGDKDSIRITGPARKAESR
jgi:hypothetical protein